MKIFCVIALIVSCAAQRGVYDYDKDYLITLEQSTFSDGPCSSSLTSGSCNKTVRQGKFHDSALGNFSDKTESLFLFIPDGDRCASEPNEECCYGDPCEPNPCQNRGECTPKTSKSAGFRCKCIGGYYGGQCEIHPNCRKCHFSALCDRNGTCNCRAGYVGDGEACTGVCNSTSLLSLKPECKILAGSLNFSKSYEDITAYSKQYCSDGRPVAAVDCRKTLKYGRNVTRFDPRTLICVPCNILLADQLNKSRSNMDVQMVEDEIKLFKVLSKGNKNLSEIEQTSAALDEMAAGLHSNRTMHLWSMKNVMDTVENMVEDASKAERILKESTAAESQKDSEKEGLRRSVSNLPAIMDKYARAVNLSGYAQYTFVTQTIALNVADPQNKSNYIFEAESYTKENGSIPVKRRAVKMHIPENTLGVLKEKEKDDLRLAVFVFQDSDFLTPDSRIGQVVHAIFRDNEGETPIPLNGKKFRIDFALPVEPGEDLKESVNNTLLRIRENFFCVFWDYRKDEWSSDGCELVQGPGERTAAGCECSHFSSFALLLRATIENKVYKIAIHSTITCIVSIVCLFATIVIYLSARELRKRRPTPVLVNVCANLMIGYVAFVIGIDGRYKGFSDLACYAVTVVMHVAFLASWVWTLIYSVDMYYAFVKSFSGSPTSRTRVLMYLAGYGIPILVVGSNLGASLVIDSNGKDMYASHFKPTYVNTHVCWVHGLSMYIGFAAPVGAILFVNLLIFIQIMRRLQNREIQSTRKSSVNQQLIAALTLVCTMGLTWAFGYIMLLAPDQTFQDVFSYTFDILNTLQGAVIFLVNCVKQKASREAWTRPIRRKFFRCGGSPDGAYSNTSSIPMRRTNTSIVA